MKSSTLFSGAACVLAVGVLATALSLMDSPHTARLRKLDAGRLSDLERISTNIGFYRKSHDRLPEKLDELNVQPKELKDPVTGEPYEYKTQSTESYELCAVFDTTPMEDEQGTLGGYMGGYGGCQGVPWWKRTQGRYCYAINVKGCK